MREVQRFLKIEASSLKARFCLLNNNLFSKPSCLRARFASCHTYSFLSLPTIAKTCQEQVSHRLTKMKLCPPALVGVSAPQSRAVRFHLTVFAAELQKENYSSCVCGLNSFFFFSSHCPVFWTRFMRE